MRAERANARARAFTLIEVMIAVAIAAIVMAVAVNLVQRQGNVVASVSDHDHTFAAASSAIFRIREELRSCVQNPNGVTSAVAPVFNVTATSITWRPCVGYLSPSSPNYSAMAAAGRLSTNNILYESFAKMIFYDAATKTVRLRHLSGSPATTTFEQVLAGDVGVAAGFRRSVEEFAFFDGESTLATPAAPTVATYQLGFYIRIDCRSSDPDQKGKVVTSNLSSKATTRQQCVVLIQPETLLNSKSKPFVGP